MSDAYVTREMRIRDLLAHRSGLSLGAGYLLYNFALDPDGGIRELRMQPVSPLTDFSFDFQDLRLVPVAQPADRP